MSVNSEVAMIMRKTNQDPGTICSSQIRYFAWASDLGWKAGRWPCIINTNLNIGNDTDFIKGEMFLIGLSFGYIYSQPGNGGIRIYIINR